MKILGAGKCPSQFLFVTRWKMFKFNLIIKNRCVEMIFYFAFKCKAKTVRII